MHLNKKYFMKIFLVGMMGAGKSHWAKILSKKLKITYYDLDNLIEILEEQSVNEIFEKEGEDYFRRVESKILKWFAEKKSFILATGGGTACFNNNISWMNKTGITLWIKEDENVIIQRLQEDKLLRPAIKSFTNHQIEEFVKQKLSERTQFYSQSKIHLSPQELNETHIINCIKNLKES